MVYRRCGAQRPHAPGHLARPLAQLRRRHAARDQARDRPHRLRPRHHPLRPRQQLRPAARAPPRTPSARSSAPTSRGYRDELIISSKAGYLMWPGPYGEWGSRKYLIASCDQSLKRLGLDYVDIFYSHRFDPDDAARGDHGRARRTPSAPAAPSTPASPPTTPQRTREAAAILKDLGTPCLIHQPSYNMINRWVERDGLKETLKELGIGSIAFTPLAQGMLTAKYLKGIPEGSRATQGKSLRPEFLNAAHHRAHPRAQRHRRAPRPDPRPDGDRLGAARRRHHLRADRRLAPLPGRGLRRRRRATSTSPPRSSPRSTATPTRRTSTSGPGPRKRRREPWLRRAGPGRTTAAYPTRCGR